MADLSESRWAETTTPLVDGWKLGSGPSHPSTVTEPIIPTTNRPPPVDLSFRLTDPAAAPFSDRSIAITRSHAASRPDGKRQELTFPALGQTIGGFKVVSELGRGVFARVYLAEQIGLAARLVALKVAEAFGDEPQLLARLQHTHIVPIHSIHDDPGTGLRLLCMPYFGGANLAQVLERSGARLPSQATGRSLIQALDDVGGRPPTTMALSQLGPHSVRFGSHLGALTGGIGSPTAAGNY